MAGTSGGARGSRAPIVGINVTPMVDVVLVLLVIMMVSANFIVQSNLSVDLPKASNGDRMAPSVAIVSIEANGTFGWNDTPITEPELQAKLEATHAENPDVNVIVSGDKGATHGNVVHVLDLAKGAGITHFAIAVEKPN